MNSVTPDRGNGRAEAMRPRLVASIALAPNESPAGQPASAQRRDCAGGPVANPAVAFELYRQRILNLVKDKLEEVHNSIGGVVGYKLNLTAEETETLLKEIERA